jgi:hypothetical protein
MCLHHAPGPTATMPPEPAAALPSRELWAQQMIQQAYFQEGMDCMALYTVLYSLLCSWIRVL